MDAYALPQLLDVSPVWLQELAAKVKADFPSPAEDLGATRIDVLEKLILHPAATYVMRTSGESMVEYGMGSRLTRLTAWRERNHECQRKPQALCLPRPGSKPSSFRRS